MKAHQLSLQAKVFINIITFCNQKQIWLKKNDHLAPALDAELYNYVIIPQKENVLQ